MKYKNKWYYFSLLFVVIASVGFYFVNNRKMSLAFPCFSPDYIAYVAIVRQSDKEPIPLYQPYKEGDTLICPLDEILRITNRTEIVTLTKSLSELRGRTEGNFTLLGLFSQQVFVSNDNKVLAFVTITLKEGTVLASQNAVLRDSRIYFTTSNKEPVVHGSLKEYTKFVFRLLREHCPREIQDSEEVCRRIGVELEELMELNEEKAEKKTGSRLD